MTQTPDQPLVDDPHRPLTRGEFAAAVVRLQSTLSASVTRTIFQENLVPLDMRTEALMALVVDLLTGRVAPGAMKLEEVEDWFNRYADQYQASLEARLNGKAPPEAVAPPAPQEEEV